MAAEVVLTEEEKALPYAKYFDRPLAPVPPGKLALFNGPPAPPEMIMPVEERNLFMEETDPYLQDGYGISADGLGFLANTTFMPEVTSDMLDWWFGWHCVENDLRYKIWDKEDHFWARADKPEYVLDPNVPWREKTWGVSHKIKENAGLGVEEIEMHFVRPRDLGFDESKIGGDGCTSMVCAHAAAIVAHKWIETPEGCWLKSRFWMGYGLDGNGNVVRKFPPGARMPEFVPKMIYGHNIKEFTNLAAFLPQIYEEEWNGKQG